MALSPRLLADEELPSRLSALIESGTDDNPALNRLLADYARYHAVLVGLGTVAVLALLFWSTTCWKHYVAIRRSVRQVEPAAAGTRFERRSTFWFGTLSAMLGLLFALIVVANLTNALNPRRGLAGSANIMASGPESPQLAQRRQAYADWLVSDQTAVPPTIRHAVADRLAWQQPKAVVSGLLLVAATILANRLWQSMFRRAREAPYSRAGRTRTHAVSRTRLAAGMALVPVIVVLGLMFIGNTQASVAPLSITMLYS